MFKFKSGIFSLLFLAWCSVVLAQAPTYECTIQNEAYTAPDQFEFDIYLARTGANTFELASFQAGLAVNASFLGGGTVTAELVGGYSDLPVEQAPSSIAFDNAQLNLKIAPQKPPRDYPAQLSLGSIVTETPVRVCRVRLTNSVGYGTAGFSPTWLFSNAGGDYRTVVSAFVGSSLPKTNTAITDEASHTQHHSLSFFIEGLYDGASGLVKAQDEMGEHFPGPVSDLVTIKLVEAVAPYDVVYQTNTANLLTDGSCSFNAPKSLNGSYWVSVGSRNAVETWSAAPIDFSSGAVAYSFTNSQSNAFYDNMVDLGDGNYALFSGDVNQDGFVDSSDLDEVFNFSSVGTQGYIPSDVTGDSWVDSSDLDMVFNNSSTGVQTIAPF